MARDHSRDAMSSRRRDLQIARKRSLSVRVRCEIADEIVALHYRALEELFSLSDATQAFAETQLRSFAPEAGSRGAVTRISCGEFERFVAEGEYVSVYFYVCHQRQILMLFAFEPKGGPGSAGGGGSGPARGKTPRKPNQHRSERPVMSDDMHYQIALKLTRKVSMASIEGGIRLSDLRDDISSRSCLNVGVRGSAQRPVRVFCGLEYQSRGSEPDDIQHLLNALTQESSDAFDLAFAEALRRKSPGGIQRIVSWSALLQAGHMRLTHAASWFDCSASGLSVLACTNMGVRRDARAGIHGLIASLISRKYASTLNSSPLLLVLSQQGLGDFLSLDLAKPNAMADLLAHYGVKLGQLSRDQRLCISRTFGQSHYYVVRFDNGCAQRIARDLECAERRDTSARRAACLSGGNSDHSHQRFLLPDLDFLIDPASLELTIVPASLKIREN